MELSASSSIARYRAYAEAAPSTFRCTIVADSCSPSQWRGWLQRLPVLLRLRPLPFARWRLTIRYSFAVGKFPVTRAVAAVCDGYGLCEDERWLRLGEPRVFPEG
jgi:hypothetical protein